MLASSRQGIVFGTGLLVGVIAGASLLAGFKDEPARPAAAVPSVGVASAACGFEPLIPARENADRFGVAANGNGKDAADVPAYIAVGEDAARQGRARDAEIAFITACRIAGEAVGGDSVEIADAKYQLAQHYAGATGLGILRAEALKRAGTLMSESATTYGAKLGVTHEKTAFAAGGLARVQTAVLEAEEPSGVPRVLLAERASPHYGVAEVTTSAMGAAPARKRERAPEPEVARPQAAEPPVVAATPPPPVNVPTCLGGDCPRPAQMVRERERERESVPVPVPGMQVSRQLKMPEPEPERVAPSQATGSAGEPGAP